MLDPISIKKNIIHNRVYKTLTIYNNNFFLFVYKKKNVRVWLPFFTLINPISLETMFRHITKTIK